MKITSPSFNFSTWQRRIGMLVMGFFVAFLGGILIMKALDRAFPPPIAHVKTSTLVLDKDGRWLHAFPVRDVTGDHKDVIRWRFAADLDDIDPDFIERLLAYEDKRFYEHQGVDIWAAMRASQQMASSGRVVSGASTITMQTARLLEPRKRTLPNKIFQSFRAMQLERRLSKDEILELYLTLAPYGGNIEGIRAASLYWFDREPDQLTDAQIAMLIALPQSPEARRPDRRPKTAKAARAMVLARLHGYGMMSAQQYDEALEARLPSQRIPLDRFAWHASLQTYKKAQADGFMGGEITSPIHLEIQQFAEDKATRAANATGDGANYAILIVENKSREIRALVGSAGTHKNGGWIDMTTASRSPGSTLKPFIYGMAFEDGTASGETLVFDAFYSFDGYSPENFSRAFYGDVTLAEALQHSLNVPAVLALDKVGADRFAQTLKATGIDVSVPTKIDEETSLAIALGGLGMSARDLAVLYAGLANDGKMQPITLYTDDMYKANSSLNDTTDFDHSFQMISPSNALKITEILRGAPAPDGRSPSLLSKSAPKIAFKTGTSYGYRDAWSVGYTDDYTVIIWAGHANGAPRNGVTGRDAALPVLFEIFDYLAGFNVENDVELAPEYQFDVGRSLTRLTPNEKFEAPIILFPENGVELFLTENRSSFTFSARGGEGQHHWFINGSPLKIDTDGKPRWSPNGVGVYKITVTDSKGRARHAQIFVRKDLEKL